MKRALFTALIAIGVSTSTLADEFNNAPGSCKAFLQSDPVASLLARASSFHLNDDSSFSQSPGRADLAFGVGTGCRLPSLTVQLQNCNDLIEQWRSMDARGIVQAVQLSTPLWTAWEDQRSGYTFSLYQGPSFCAASVIGGRVPRQ